MKRIIAAGLLSHAVVLAGCGEKEQDDPAKKPSPASRMFDKKAAPSGARGNKAG